MFQLIEYVVYFILCNALTQLLTCTSVYLNPSGVFSIWSSSKRHQAFFAHAKGSTPVLPSAISLGSYINLLTMWNCSGLLHGWWPIHQCSRNRVCDSKDEDSSASAPTCITHLSISVFTFWFYCILSYCSLAFFQSLMLALNKFKVTEDHKKYSIDEFEPLVLFGLSCGMFSSPAVSMPANFSPIKMCIWFSKCCT